MSLYSSTHHRVVQRVDAMIAAALCLDLFGDGQLVGGVLLPGGVGGAGEIIPFIDGFIKVMPPPAIASRISWLKPP